MSRSPVLIAASRVVFEGNFSHVPHPFRLTGIT
jgi:hypothetical protein